MKQSKAEARAAFERYVSSESERVDAFRRAVAARGGPSPAQLDLTRGSLRSLGAWLLESTPSGPEDDQTPQWAVGEPDDPTLPSPWMLEGLTAYLVATVRHAHPAVAWRLEEDRRSMHAGLPVLAGVGPVEFWPVSSVAIVLSRARRAASPDPDWLLALFDGWSAKAAAARAEGTADTDLELEQDLDDVEVSPIVGDRDWNAEISISESAEAVLGGHEFDGLYDRFSAIPGVQRIEWEDRERFLVRLATDADLDAVRGAAREAMRAALGARRA